MTETARDLQLYEGAPPPMTAANVRQQINLIQEIMRDAMKVNEHYGVIPGCSTKPTLLKAGAEKLNLTFRMAPKYVITKNDLGNGHREYEIICTLYTIGSSRFLGEGVGSCSTMESKYRYRNVSDYEVTDKPIPKDAKEKKAEYRKQGYGMKKVDGVWVWVKFKDEAKTENPDIADTYNTVLKMAKKRALVDAVLTATAASDIFTQDIEDFSGNETPPIIDAEFTPVHTPGTEQKSSPAPSDKPTGGNGEKVITEGQRKLVYAKSKAAGIDDVDIWLHENYEIDKVSEISFSKLNEILEGIGQYGQ